MGEYKDFHNLSPGVRLRNIFYSGGDIHTVGSTVKEIVVTMEAGQTGNVPWARVVFNNGEVALANLALVEYVILEDRDA